MHSGGGSLINNNSACACQTCTAYPAPRRLAHRTCAPHSSSSPSHHHASSTLLQEAISARAHAPASQAPAPGPPHAPGSLNFHQATSAGSCSSPPIQRMVFRISCCGRATFQMRTCVRQRAPRRSPPLFDGGAAARPWQQPRHNTLHSRGNCPGALRGRLTDRHRG